MTLAASYGTLLGPWWQAAAARRDLRAGRAAGSKPAKRWFGRPDNARSPPKRWLWPPCKAPFLGLGGRLHCTEGPGSRFRSPQNDDLCGRTMPLLGPWDMKPAKRWLWQLCKAPFLGLGGRLQLHGGTRRDLIAGRAAGSKPAKWWWWFGRPDNACFWALVAGCSCTEACETWSPLKDDFGGRARHPSWALVAGCSCTEGFEGGGQVSKPAKRWFGRPAGCSCTEACETWSPLKDDLAGRTRHPSCRLQLHGGM